MLFWASLTHSIASGLPWPILSFWASSAHSNSLFPWTFVESFGLPRWPKLPYPLLLGFMGFPSTPYSLNSLLRASLAHSHLLSISYDVHGFTSSFFWTPFGPLAFFEAHLLLSRPMIHYSCYSGLMVFFSIYQIFFSHIVGLLPAIGPLCQSGHQHLKMTVYLTLLMSPLWLIAGFIFPKFHRSRWFTIFEKQTVVLVLWLE